MRHAMRLGGGMVETMWRRLTARNRDKLAELLVWLETTKNTMNRRKNREGKGRKKERKSLTSHKEVLEGSLKRSRFWMDDHIILN
jgi:hypothetical protein